MKTVDGMGIKEVTQDSKGIYRYRGSLVDSKPIRVILLLDSDVVDKVDAVFDALDEVHFSDCRSQTDKPDNFPQFADGSRVTSLDPDSLLCHTTCCMCE